MKGFGLEGRSVLVTGAASGIGRAIALAFAAEGARLTLGDVNAAAGEAVAQTIRSGGGEAIGVGVDVRDDAQVRAMVAAAVGAWGRLDAAVNAAGIGSPAPGDVTACTDEHWAAVMAVNLTGVFHCLRAEVAQMLAQGGGGSVVNIASVGGITGSTRAPAYIASKHGVVGLTRATALDHGAQGVRINAVCPGYTGGTAMMDGYMAKRPDEAAKLAAQQAMGRLAETREIADAVVWLCSDRASYVTGTVLPVDGGFTAA